MMRWMLLCLAPIAGCTDGGILIKPVTTRQELVESVLHRDSFFSATKIAIIDVTGLILNAPEPQLVGEGRHQVMLFKEQMDKARRDPQVKALIVRINSPGGGVVASEIMHDELMHYRKATGNPVTAVMTDVAASGGYYIAWACDEIVAQSGGITGSIGVIVQLFDLSETMEMIGVKGNAIKSGHAKDAGSPFRELKPNERAMFQSIVDDMHERFIQVVVRGRPELSEQQVRALADGRVYSGTQAIANGLVDRIAPMQEVVDSLKTRIGAESIRLVTYRRPLDYKPNYYAATPGPISIGLVNVELSALSTLLHPRFMYLWTGRN